MEEHTLPTWLKWAREIQAISQNGLTYSDSEYNRHRFRRLMEVAAEIVQSHTQLPKESVLQNFLLQHGYATPKIDVRGAVIRDEKILLVRECSDKRWAMPGGWADVGEIPSNMVVREVWEESGLEVLPRKVIGVYDANRGNTPLSFYHAYKIVFLCEIIGGHSRPGDETIAVDFFGFDQLPPLSTERTNRRHLSEVLAHLKDYSRPAAFD